MTPQPFRWTGAAMLPLRPREAEREFIAGRVYQLAAVEDRSAASHRQYFAALNEAWQNLPEDLAERFPTAEHLRKYALIRTGFRDERTIVASSKAEARRIAAFVRPMDEFAIVSVNECAVIVWTAKSQSARAMGRKQFEASKAATLDFLADTIGVRVRQIETERAA